MLPTSIPDRYELKYIVPEDLVPELREAIGPFCSLDAHTAASPTHEYVIESLYFDTAGHDLYRVSRERRPDRFKVRVRRYGVSAGESPVFLEVKRKTQGIVRKTRARLDAESWRARLTEPLSAEASPAERHFRDRVQYYHLEPALLVRYEREAWVSDIDAYARVTFDRHMCVQPSSGLSFASDPCGWIPVDHRHALKTAVPRAVVLELKCTSDVPRWMASLTERFCLGRRGVSKYCTGVERALTDRAVPLSFLQLCSNS